MGRKTADAECRANYENMVGLFRNVIPDQGRFEVVYGCGLDVGMMNFVVVRKTTYTYSSYAIGYDKEANEIVVLPIDVDLKAYGDPIYLKHHDVGKAKQSWWSKEITIRTSKFPRGYIQFSIPEHINDDPDNVCVQVKQNEEAKNFIDFFKGQFTK